MLGSEQPLGKYMMGSKMQLGKNMMGSKKPLFANPSQRIQTQQLAENKKINSLERASRKEGNRAGAMY
jgi:hypothetical protein